MKKWGVFIVVVLTMALAGCCTNPTNPADTTKTFGNCLDKAKGWVCTNRQAIEDRMAQAQTTITMLNTEFGSLIPVQYQPIIVAAQAVIALGQQALASANCPTDQQAAAVNDASMSLNMARAKVNATRMGMKGMKLIP